MQEPRERQTPNPENEPIRQQPSESINLLSTLKGVGHRLFLTGEHVAARVTVTDNVRIEALIGKARDRVSVVTTSEETEQSKERQVSGFELADTAVSGQSADTRQRRFLEAVRQSSFTAAAQRHRVRPPSKGSWGERTVHLRPAGWLSRAATWLLGTVLTLGLAAGLLLYNARRAYESAAHAHIDMRVTPITSQIVGEVRTLHVVPNQLVRAGDPLVELDPNELQLRVQEAKASLEEAEAAAIGSVGAESDASTELTEAQAALEKLQTQLHDSAREQTQLTARLARLEAEALQQHSGLEANTEADSDAVAAARARDRLVATRRTHSAELVRSQKLTAAVAATQQRIAELQRQEKAKETQHQAALPHLAAVRAHYEDVMRQLSRTKIVAPFSGIIGAELASEGDYVSPAKPLMSIWQSEHSWVTASFDETQLPSLAEGQTALLRVVPLALDLRGRVESLTADAVKRARNSATRTRRRIPLRIALLPGQSGTEKLRPGMTVEARVLVR